VICLASHLDHDTGWSNHARGLARALARYERTELLPLSKLNRRWSLPFGRSDSVGITLGAVEMTRALRTRFHVAFAVGETSRIPRQDRLKLAGLDMIWALSRWGQGVLENSGVSADLIRIVPAGIDSDELSGVGGATSAVPKKEDGVYRFVCVGKWEERKGTRDLARAFAAEFAPSEPVELIMHCGWTYQRSVDWHAALARELAEGGNAQARVRTSEPGPRSEYVALLRSADAFVLPTRAEGWGLPILEAMACGLPCIVTDYSGVQEYANAANAFLIPVQAMEPVADAEFYDPSFDWGSWALPDDAALRRLMRYVVENPGEARRRGEVARSDATTRWTWDNAARLAMRHIAELREGSGKPTKARGT
jgi:glycosyltransferase involved in cell wall biosynthesis